MKTMTIECPDQLHGSCRRWWQRAGQGCQSGNRGSAAPLIGVASDGVDGGATSQGRGVGTPWRHLSVQWLWAMSAANPRHTGTWSNHIQRIVRSEPRSEAKWRCGRSFRPTGPHSVPKRHGTACVTTNAPFHSTLTDHYSRVIAAASKAMAMPRDYRVLEHSPRRR